ncbi:mitosis inhibitor protein kinase swe1 [Coemansia furcata]|uniref:Mitosis inhibitor protein kinase swe1 n=1 Tax=Coemansia furcata TaxID=417177 RepID=A0ACC1LQE7_9FUNG|nr:mitosis inhibitor protein kinase swe1 [Coemansia furcata]
MTDTPRRPITRAFSKNNTPGTPFLTPLQTSVRSRRRTPTVLRSYQSFPHLPGQEELGWHTDTAPSRKASAETRRRGVVAVDVDNYDLTTPTPSGRRLNNKAGGQRRMTGNITPTPMPCMRLGSEADSPSPSPFCIARTTQRRLMFSPADIAAAASAAPGPVTGEAGTPASAPASGAPATMFTPAATKLVRPDPAAFMSTGLQSRKQHVRTRSGGAQVAPETPCKRGAMMEPTVAAAVATPWGQHQSAPKVNIDGDPFRLGKHRAASPGSLRRTRKRAHVTVNLRDSCEDLRALLDTPSRPRHNTLVDDDVALRPPPGFRIPAPPQMAKNDAARWSWATSDACSDSTVAGCDTMDLEDGLGTSAGGMERPQMPQIVQGCATNYAHFLDRSYFQQSTRSLPFLAPSREFHVEGLGYLDYFTHQFDVLGRVGEGEFSTVYSVRGLDDGHLYAIKRARRAFAGRQERVRRLREVELLWAVPPSDSIVRLVAAWEQLGLLYMQFELCDHGNLAGWLDARAAAGDERLPEHFVWSLLAHAADGLSRLHERNIAHLDVKPANFLLGPRFGEPGAERHDGWLKLADFGHAVCLPPSPDTWVDEGDREYLAPEMLSGAYSTAVDVFSLGMMMLEIVADVVLPANGPDWHNLRVACFDDPAFTYLPYSSHLVDTIKQMLHPDHARRPTLDDVLATARCALCTPSIATVEDEDDYEDIDDDFLRPAPLLVPRHPMLRASTAGPSIGSGLVLHPLLTSLPSASELHVPRPASAGPGLARRTASAPGAAPASARGPGSATGQVTAAAR